MRTERGRCHYAGYDGAETDEYAPQAWDDSPVTAADIAAHTVILEGLRTLTPDIPVLSEDPPAWEVRQHWQRYWLVDPLGGAKEFISAMANSRSIYRAD